MIDLPSVKPTYSDDMKVGLSPTQCQAGSNYGVERRFLHFASQEYLSDPDEQYRLHHYNTLIVKNQYGQIKVTHDEQFKNALDLINNGMLWCQPPGIIVINSPHYFFDSSPTEKDRSAEAFLAHLLCSLAHRTMTIKPARHTHVHFLEIMQLDHSRGYRQNERQLLIWGPITEHFSSYDYNKTIQFLYSFRNYTRLLLTSTQDMEDLLNKLHLNASHVDYFFNFGVEKGNDCPDEILNPLKKKKAATASRSRSPRKKAAMTTLKPTIGI